CHSRPLARLSPVMRGTPILERQLWVRTPPSQLFKNQAPAPQQARLDDVILTLSTTDGDVTTGTADGTEVAQRMAASLAQEREPFDSYYRQFLFAFPDRRNPVVDSAGMRESALLRERLGGRTVTVLRHRYPVDLGTLFEPVRQQLRLG